MELYKKLFLQMFNDFSNTIKSSSIPKIFDDVKKQHVTMNIGEYYKM